MAKKITTVIRLQIAAGKATPAPPIGPALGQHGVKIMDFCAAYNAQTKDKGDTVIPVEITVYDDRSFTFVLKTPPTSVLIKEALGIPKGSGEPHLNKVGKLSREKAEQIAKTKLPDLNATSLEGAIKIVVGTARSMGVEISR